MESKFRPEKVFIPTRKKGSWDNWLPDEAILTYAVLAQYSFGFYPINIEITPTMIAMILFRTGERPTSAQIKYAKIGLCILYEENPQWVTPINENKSRWMINSIKIREIDKDAYAYTYLAYKEILIISKLYDRYKTENMAFYVKFRSTFDVKYGINHFSKEQLSKCMHIKFDTLKTRIQKLIDKKLILVYHPPTNQIVDRFAGDSNIYYLPGDFDKADKYNKETRKSNISNMKGK